MPTNLDSFGASFKAGGNISPSVFVKVSTAADETVLQASTNEAVEGVSQVGLHNPPGLAGSDAYAAVAGEDVMVYGNGSVCMLAIAGTVTRGDYLKSDSAGKGVSIATTGATAQEVGAKALESGSSGDLIRVRVHVQTKVYPALS